jgi:hypothetical protein
MTTPLNDEPTTAATQHPKEIVNWGVVKVFGGLIVHFALLVLLLLWLMLAGAHCDDPHVCGYRYMDVPLLISFVAFGCLLLAALLLGAGIKYWPEALLIAVVAASLVVFMAAVALGLDVIAIGLTLLLTILPTALLITAWPKKQ